MKLLRNNAYRLKKLGHYLLLEVLIAFMIVVLCILPLIYPNVLIVKSQQKFIEKIDLDHQVNLFYGEIAQRLYLNKIPWNLIETQREMPIDDLLKADDNKHFPFTGSYQFKILKTKPPPPANRTLNLVELTLKFYPTGATEAQRKANTLEYHYNLYIVRALASE